MSNRDVIPINPEIDNILSEDGGLVRGAMFELYGPDGEGKSTFAMISTVAAQKIGLKVGWIDVEYSFNESHAKFFGVNIEDLDLYMPEVGEDALEKVFEMCNIGYGLVVVDSVAGLVPRAVDEAEHIGDSKQFAQVASLLAQSIPKIRKAAYNGNTCILFLNQIRAKIQKFGMGPPTESFGGFTLKHCVSGRFEIRKVAWIKYSTETIGFKVRIRAPKKNRFAPPNRDGYLDIIVDHNFDQDKLSDKRKTKLNIINIKDDDD